MLPLDALYNEYYSQLPYMKWKNDIIVKKVHVSRSMFKRVFISLKIAYGHDHMPNEDKDSMVVMIDDHNAILIQTRGTIEYDVYAWWPRFEIRRV